MSLSNSTAPFPNSKRNLGTRDSRRLPFHLIRSGCINLGSIILTKRNRRRPTSATPRHKHHCLNPKQHPSEVCKLPQSTIVIYVVRLRSHQTYLSLPCPPHQNPLPVNSKSRDQLKADRGKTLSPTKLRNGTQKMEFPKISP